MRKLISLLERIAKSLEIMTGRQEPQNPKNDALYEAWIQEVENANKRSI